MEGSNKKLATLRERGAWHCDLGLFSLQDGEELASALSKQPEVRQTWPVAGRQRNQVCGEVSQVRASATPPSAHCFRISAQILSLVYCLYEQRVHAYLRSIDDNSNV